MRYDETKRVLAALEREGVEYVVVGAVAVNLLGLARATEPLDIFIAPKRDNVERLRAALRSIWSDPSIEEISADDLLGDYPAVQYLPPEGTFYIDILTRLGELFRFEDVQSQRVDFDGIEVNVATPRTLYRMKKDTVRSKDRGDAERLRHHFKLEET